MPLPFKSNLGTRQAIKGAGMVDRKEINWKSLRIRPDTRRFLEIVASSSHEDFVEAVILFGSEAKESATLTSDVDLALISTRALSISERRSILKNIPFDLNCKVDCRIVCLRMGDLYMDRKMHIGTSVKRDGVVIYEKLP